MPYDWLHITPIDLEEPNESLQMALAKKKVTNPKGTWEASVAEVRGGGWGRVAWADVVDGDR